MFAVGNVPGTSLTFNVPIVDDDLVEGQEDIDIMATIIGGSGSFVGGGITATGDINILDDDRMSYLTCLMSMNRRAKPVLVVLIAMMILDQNTTHTLAQHNMHEWVRFLHTLVWLKPPWMLHMMHKTVNAAFHSLTQNLPRLHGSSMIQRALVAHFLSS